MTSLRKASFLAILSAMILGAALAVLAADEIMDKAKEHVAAMRADGSITNVIDLLISQGDVCTVKGHHWGPDMRSMTLAVVRPDGYESRQCGVCGTRQSRDGGSWK